MTELGAVEVPTPPGAPGVERPHVRVLRNATWLVAAQVLGIPLQIVVNALLARYLGPADYGHIYLAATLCSFGFLAVEWGQGAALPAAVAVDRGRVGELLGSALAWRVAAGVVVWLVLNAACWAIGGHPDLRAALALIGLISAVAMVGTACQDAIRGFERTDIAAYGIIGQQVLSTVAILPVLLLGGRLRAVLGAQAVAVAIAALVLLLALRPLGVDGLRVRRATVRRLLREGSPFAFLALALLLQPNVNAVLLGRFSPPEVMGWFAASLKLTGALTFPATALITALYPALCRLQAADRDGYRHTARAALRATLVLVVPVALGCALYPEIGVAIFSREKFGAAEDNLRILSVYLLLVYFSMVLGTCASAAGRQRAWAAIQLGCVAVAAALDVWLIPSFQARTGNGGLGVCVSLVGCEVLMLAAALWLAPREILDRALVRTALRALAAGTAMAVVAHLLRAMNPFASAPLSVAAYGACVWVLGSRTEIVDLKQLLARKLSARS